MISSSTEFWYNGHSSKEFGITNVYVDGANSNTNNMFSEPFLGSRTINEEKLKWNPKPYFYNSQEACKTFALSFGFDKNIMVMNKTSLRRIAMWFSDLRQYHELWFSEDCNLNANGDYDITSPRRVYRVMITGDSTINHFGLDEGYISLSVKTDSPYCYSPILGGKIWSENWEENDGDGSYIYFGNYADMVIKPQIQIIVGQKNPDDITDDPHNQSIKIIGQKIEDNQLPPITYDGFQRDYPYTPTDYTKFPSFEFSGGVKATGFFQLLGTVFYGEKFYLGDKTYEFDLGMGKPYNKNEINNILVPINDGVKAYNTLRFNDNSNVTDGSTVTIGTDQCFEYDWNDIVASTNVKVDISNYVANAKGILHLNSNLMPNQQIVVGDITYTGKSGTREDIIKMTNHMLTDGSEQNYNVFTNRTNLISDNVNISTKSSRDISKCLVRNITKNPSDLGIRKMGYIDKDFVWVLNDGESGEDYQYEIDNVPVDGKITVSFDEPINTSTINSDTIQIRDIEGNLINCTFATSVNDGGKTIYITPSVNYNYDKDYFIFVSPEIKTLKGNNLNETRRIKFHTKKEGDTTTDNYNNVSPVKMFSIYSAQKIDSSTLIDSNVYVVKSGSSTHENINMTLTNSGKEINVSPKTKYDYGGNYELHLTTNIKDVDSNSILSSEKIIKFTIQSEMTNESHIDSDFTPIGNVPISETIKIPLNGKLDSSYVNNSIVGGAVVLQDGDKNNIDIDINIDSIANNVLDITPKLPLNYNSYYFLYISQSVKLDGKSNIEAPLMYKLITITEESAKNIIDDATNAITDKSLLQNDYSNCDIDKVITYHYNASLDPSTINTANVWVLDSNKNKVNIIVQPTTDNSGIQIFPSPVWSNGENYSIFINNQIKITNKPRVFAGSVPPDGDYENAVTIFGEYFDIIKTNGFKVSDSGHDIIDNNGNKIIFNKNDIVFQNNYGLTSSDFNADGSVKAGTVITSIPIKNINVEDAFNCASTNRNTTKLKMQEKMSKIKGESWLTQQVVSEDTQILSFTVRDNNQKISVDINSSIILSSSNFNKQDVKKIIGMTANDNIDLYEESDMDFCVDPNSLVPSSIPVGAKVYAGKSTIANETIPDDYTNACNILAPLGYTIVDSTSMTLDEKKKIVFKPWDIVIGGVLAGTLPSDFDPKTGNLLTSKPSETNPTDTRTTRVTGMPLEVNIYPAIRLQGDTSDPGRAGTKKAMQEFADRYNKEKKGGTLGEEYESNICPKGLTLMYKVPDGSTVYGAGTDFYNGISYLSSLGYKFVNVGMMTDAQKQSIGFTKNDIVLGGTQATDTATTSAGQSVTVTGIGAIALNGATRLGGVDRYDTENKIKQYSESLKIKDIAVGDIVKLQITIDNPDNMIIDESKTAEGDDPALENTTTSNRNTRIEYHIVKSIDSTLSRNRIHIEFYENIRTTSYISKIEVIDLYKLYDTRLSEDYLFDAPYEFKEENLKSNTMINIVKAINDTGTQGIEYSERTFKHPIVLAQIANDNEIELDAIEPGTQGNIPVSLIDKFDPLNKFLTATLIGGQDCTQSNAIKALAQTILSQNDLPERYNKDQYTVSYDATSLTITHKMYGEKYNNIVCLANVTQQYQTPYIITNNGTGVSNSSLINLKDYLTREKQIAKWDNMTTIGGIDPSVDKIIEALKAKLTSTELDSDNKVMFNFIDMLADDGITKTGINIEYYKYGEEGNVVLNTTAVNGKISGKKLSGGIDGLYVGEVITMDCEKKFITSSLDKDRMLNFNGNWLEIPLDGVKLVTKKGVFSIEYKYQEKYYI